MRRADPCSAAGGRRNPAGRIPDPYGISAYALAGAIKVPRSRAKNIVLGRRAIATDTAIPLARYFGMPPQFWLNLQTRYDLDVGDRSMRRKIEQEVVPRDAA